MESNQSINLIIQYFQKTGRIFRINGKICEIPEDYISTFKAWNLCAIKRKSAEYDKRLVHAVLLMFVEKEDLAKFSIDKGLMDFIQGNLFLQKLTHLNSLRLNNILIE